MKKLFALLLLTAFVIIPETTLADAECADKVLGDACSDGAGVCEYSSGGGPISGELVCNSPITIDEDIQSGGTSISCEAGQFCALAPIPGLTDPSTSGSLINSNDLQSFFNNLYRYLIGISAILAVGMIMWAGAEISTNQGSLEKQLDARGKITSAIFGLILVLSPYLVFRIINPSILNLSLSIPPIDTTVSYGGGVSSGPTRPSVEPAPEGGGCTPANRNNDYLVTYVCTDRSASDSADASCPAGLQTRTFLGSDTEGFVVYCSGKTEEFAYFQYSNLSGVLETDPKIVPAAEKAFNVFYNGCTSAGGYVAREQVDFVDRANVGLGHSDCSPEEKASIPNSSSLTYGFADSYKICYHLDTYCQAPL